MLVFVHNDWPFPLASSDFQAVAPIRDRSPIARTSCEKYRKSYMCPVENCKSGRAQKKLSNHLIAYHRITDANERARLLALAKTQGATKHGSRPVAITIQTAFKRLEASNQHLEVPIVPRRKGKTNHLVRFNIDTEPSLLNFIANLESFDGGNTPPREARQIAADISKYLAWACSKKVDWSCLANADGMFKYIQLLQANGIGPNGLTTKIQRLLLAIKYLHRTEKGKVPNSVIERLESWKSSFAKERSATNLSAALTSDDSPEVMAKVNALFSHPELIREIDAIKESISGNYLLSRQEHNTLVTYLFLRLVCSNWQRPAAAINLTVAEAKSPIAEGDKVVVKSYNHKTKS